MQEIELGAQKLQTADFDEPYLGPALTIAVTDENAPAQSWLIHVFARLPAGQAKLGTVRSEAVPEGGKSRVLCFASCPGARTWFLIFERGPGWTDGAAARFQFARSEENLSPPGLTPNNNYATVLP